MTRRPSLALEHLIGRREAVLMSQRLRHIASGEIFGGFPNRRRDRRLDQRHVDLPPLPVPQLAH